ncbi:NADPH-dependent F420 reductase [Mycetocola sp.]|uniref:NADPH-dependent F420 reductase n=1 Tax=Mycetocola sp. TaxID=1871042 RepID=UPI00398A22EA
MATIAVIGVGRVGSAVARTALKAGYDVHVSGSGTADDIALLAEIIMPGARPMGTADAVLDADIVIVAVPLNKYTSVDPSLLEGKVVIDVMNYWAPIDGEISEFEQDAATSSEVVSRHFAGSRVVKTLNHIGYHDLEEHAIAAGAPGRRALAVASDDEPAARLVMEMIDRFGFDAAYAGPLRTGRVLQPGTEIFNGAFSKAELEHELTLQPASQA